MEALTLEASLTKTLQPRYNILLKDDKHFPYVRLDEKRISHVLRLCAG